MKSHKNIFRCLGIIALLSASNALLSASIHNNTMWDIKVKSAKSNQNAIEYVIPAGQTHQIAALAEPFSIRRSGKGSSYVSYWTEVPVNKIFDGRAPQYYDTLVIESGVTGWNFRAKSNMP